MAPTLPVKSSILGISVSPVTVEDLRIYITSIIQQKRKALVLSINVYGFNLAYQHAWLKNLYNSTELVLSDGSGVVMAGRFLGYQIPGRITFADWMWQIGEFAERANFSLFFLGSHPGVAERAAECMKERYRRLCILGTHHGFFDKSVESAENMAVIAQINAVKPDILVVGFGMPIQERWLLENWSKLDTHIGLNAGAVFEYVSGNVSRAPRWMTDHGLEWLGRLIIEPRRLWRRYLIGNPFFLWRILMQKLGILKF